MKKTKKSFAIVLFILCTSLTVPPSAPMAAQVSAAPAKQIVLNKKSATMQPGKTLKLKLKNTKKKPTWKTSNKKVATVNKSGKVTAKKTGKATITAKLAKKSYKCKITVKAKTSDATESSDTTETPDTAESPDTTETSASTVWISATGKKYHKINNCGTMNPDKARKMSLSEAKEKGYEPCSKCF